jgi:hypothetical protein
LRAEGLAAGGAVVCFDEKKTAGAPAKVLLTVDPPIVKPDGEAFQIKANGTDVALILATIVDANNNWCPTATNVVTFSVSGAAGSYRGGSDQMVTAGQPLGYHSPLDPNLSAEGGYCHVAVRSTFTPGTVNVTATASGLTQGTTSFTVVPLPTTTVQRPFTQSEFLSEPVLKIGMAGTTVRYYLSRPASVSIEILGANGRVLKSISSPKQAEGWHPIKLSGAESFSDAKGNGVYFARFAVDGAYQCVKRILVIR